MTPHVERKKDEEFQFQKIWASCGGCSLLEHVGMKGRQLIFMMDVLVPPFSHNNIIVFLAIGDGLTADLATG